MFKGCEEVAINYAIEMYGVESKEDLPYDFLDMLDEMNALAGKCGGYIASRQIVAQTIVFYETLSELENKTYDPFK